jgi:hypothetical protein
VLAPRAIGPAPRASRQNAPPYPHAYGRPAPPASQDQENQFLRQFHNNYYISKILTDITTKISQKHKK